MSILKTGRRSTLARAGASVALAATAFGGFATAASAATTVTQQAVTLSSPAGAQAAGTLTVSLPTTAATKFVSGNVGVQFQNLASTAAPATSTCATNPGTNAAGSFVTVTAASTRVVSATKMAITYPNLAAGGSTPNPYWLVCVYNAAESGGNITGTATVIGKASYLAAGAPTVTAISPNQGPATGGQTVTVTGTNFPTSIASATPLSATLGGQPLGNITPISSTSFTATTPALPSGTSADLTVTTGGGSKTLAAAYTYANGLTVSPSTVPSNGTAVDVDVTGTGFSSLTFTTTTGATPNDANSHVYLSTNGVYNPVGFVAGASPKTTWQGTECQNVLVISDSELICTIDPTKKNIVAANNSTVAAGALPTGMYQVLVVDKGDATGVAKSAYSSGATFTVAAF